MKIRKQKFKIDKQDFVTLEEMGYEVKQLTPYHFRIGRDVLEYGLDVYPTTRTYVKFHTDSKRFEKGKKYSDLIFLVEDTLDTFAKFKSKL